MEEGCNRRKSAPEVMSANKPVELEKIKPARKQPLKTIKPGIYYWLSYCVLDMRGGSYFSFEVGAKYGGL